MITQQDVELVILHPSFAGFVGSVISLRFAKAISLSDKFLHILAGMACVWYVAPICSALLSIQTSLGKPAFGFITGLLGIDLILKFVDWFKKADLAEIIGAIKRGGSDK